MKAHWMYGLVCGAALAVGCGNGGGSSGTGGSTGGSGGATTGSGATGGTGGSGGATTTGGGGTGGTGGATTGMGGGDACNACVTSKDIFKKGTMCGNADDACLADADCPAWLMCGQNCLKNNNTTECFAACDQAASMISNLYLPIEKCVCDACKAECAAGCP